MLAKLGYRSLSAIAPQYRTTVAVVRHFAEEEGLLLLPASAPWSQREDKQLRALWGTIPQKELGQTLRRSLYALRIRATELGLAQHHRPWTRRDDALLKKLYGTMGTKAIARVVGRGEGTVSIRLSQLGLRSKRRSAYRLWSAEEDTLLRKLYGVIPTRELLKQLTGRG